MSSQMKPQRFVQLDPATPLQVLTATARGMIDNHFIRAAQRAHTELMTAVAEAGRMGEVRSRISLYPDEPLGANDARCRYIAGVLFGYDLATQQGECRQPEVALSAHMAWMPIAAGRFAVFRHRGPPQTLFRAWQAIYREWLPGSGQVMRRAVPMELQLSSLDDVPPEEVTTEIWLPVV
jgi:AraC family transcriptional regulator